MKSMKRALYKLTRTPAKELATSLTIIGTRKAKLSENVEEGVK